MMPSLHMSLNNVAILDVLGFVCALLHGRRHFSKVVYDFGECLDKDPGERCLHSATRSIP